MLIPSPRHTAADIALWAEIERADRVHSHSKMLGRNYRRAQEAASEFIAAGPCWCGVSWGKDSVVTAHMVLSIDRTIPVRWIRVEPIKSPECEQVRDAFLKSHPGIDYDEIEVWCNRSNGEWHATGTLEAGVRQIESSLGDRTILGIRAGESTTRAIRVFRWGENTERKSAPIGRLTEQDVYSVLYRERLPVHPAYAMLGGGRWRRRYLRVSSLGGKRGQGHGRAEWEQEYYGDVLRRIEASGR